ncbi:probable myosin light chain kinase DDB_G0279831 isoform X1 [Lucilia cuprina]|uniref:probable myosin light chain kinase DDB_G0279831 isoform X1 n=1 Tax=Lucilia cuprina TaxID=7375 RepID=UPI001F06AF1D|nr:probable myosin light chain kinase DDB_G0279831 isoform X1 [Lucilia cuprina]
MEDHLHGQQGTMGELEHHDGSASIYESVGGNSNRASKTLTSSLGINDIKCSLKREPCQDEQNLQLGDKAPLTGSNIESLRRRSPDSVPKSTRSMHAHIDNVDNTPSNIEQHDINDSLKQLRNGCDNTSIDQNQDIYVLPGQLEDIKLNQAFSDEVLKENVTEKSRSNKTDYINSSPFTLKTNSTFTSCDSSAVIPLAGLNTTKARDSDECRPEKDKKEPCVKQRLDEHAATRGKNIAHCFTNKNTDAVQLSNSSISTLAISNQMTLKHACQSPYITVLPLHACNTFNHFHHNHLHIQHHHNHSHNNYQSESENFANELTNALSSRLLFQITNTNNFSYCTNSALKNQNKRQSSFLKSQSLEIVQDSPSILYPETDDDDEHIFFQLPEIDEHDLLYKQNQRDSHPFKDHRQKSSKLSNQEDELGTRSRRAKTDAIDSTYHNDENDENIDDEGVVINRSLSLSSQKTGIALKSQSLESRPIYPNVPYSPYASPYSSPRSNRRRPPLRESRRISIEQSGSFLQLNQYKLMDQIGQGSYGLVKLAYSEEDSTHYAMKILSKRRLLRQAGLMKRGPKKSTSPLDRVYREIAVLKKLDHPNVVKLVEVLDDPVEDSLYMVFELVKQGEVLSVPTKNPLTEERSWSVFRDTLLGLEYLHYQRIIHADIKPGNLLLTECGRVKIADLGVCNEFIGEDATMTNCSTAGTPAFRPPESLNVGQNMYCGKAADIWALGATLYALVYGNVPFEASSVPALYEKIKNEELSFPENPKTSVELRDCIKCMLKKDPADRITLPQLKEHVWVTAGGLHPLPSEEENCRLVQVNDDDINSVVRSIPKLDTLILIKTMLKKHSFGNPFSRGISGRAPQRGGSRLERFIRAGRSNSAPGSYNMIVDRQLSGDNILPALTEHSPSNCTNEESQ